ncbi:MAG: ATP-binding cassette domain-containing protein [Calditrichaeota bacterium]|nr:MAG: ATP-binding cassette domain-containing protein [Calditrichota bacterium]MBL1206782.1 ATP-binding cassette domain-containing protein [Calditrichota bacterium]NOG46610.1 ATP-binding cassette domain-containing protein [Calditrichota bacterium]
MPILEIDNIFKQYGDYIAVNNVSFSVEQGNIYGILGPNGAGKTTTIRMIMNIIAPDSGTVSLFGQEMSDQLKSRIGYLPEERGLYKKMKVKEVLLFLGELHGMKRNTAESSTLKWLEKLQLIDNKDSRVDELSKGMQQKLQIIGTIMHDPDLIILDEPFSGLDPVNVNLVKNIMMDLKNDGKAIMLSTHMMDAAEKLCDDILMINKGNKVLDGDLDQILSQHGKNSVQIEFKGDNKIFDEIAILEKVDHFPNYVEVQLKEGHKTSELLKLIIDKIEVTSLQTMKSSLNEIFISLAGGTENE